MSEKFQVTKHIAEAPNPRKIILNKFTGLANLSKPTRKSKKNNAGNINFDGGWYSGSSKCKKIITTTDTLLQKKEIIGQDNSGYIFNPLYIAQPSDSFIKKYIEEYNAGRTILKVLVEYEKVYPKHFTYNPSEIIIFNLKVDSNNTTTIKRVEPKVYTEKDLSIFKTLNDDNFLKFIYNRLHHVHKEDENLDYMHKLKSIVDWVDDK